MSDPIPPVQLNGGGEPPEQPPNGDSNGDDKGEGPSEQASATQAAQPTSESEPMNVEEKPVEDTLEDLPDHILKVSRD